MRRALVLGSLFALFATAAALGGSGVAGLARSSVDSSNDMVDYGDFGIANWSTLSLALSARDVEYGDRVFVSGSVEPAAAGAEVVLELGSDDAWRELGRISTVEDGRFSLELRATRGGSVRARTVVNDAVTDPAMLVVRPRVEAAPARAPAFKNVIVSARIRPVTYSGLATVTVKRNGAEVASLVTHAARGHVQARIPTPGPGRFAVVFSLPDDHDLRATFAATRLVATAPTLVVGSSGPAIAALRQRLTALHFHLPVPSPAFGPELADAVIAFQKVYGLPRTGSVGALTWKALGRVAPLRPRYRGPALHIEIDKTRQILAVVQHGAVAAVLPVSSGATGNTPEGRHQIRWKALATKTWLGPAILYRTMTFSGNNFAIHGFPSVPAYPASHGCVRIPIWTADWLYNQSSVGETVYVYH